MLNIAVNGLLIDDKKAGIGYYGYHLIQQLKKSTEISCTFFLQESAGCHCPHGAVSKNCKNNKGRIIEEQLRLPFVYNRFDLVHFIDYASPVLPIRKPFVATVHDLAVYKFPETFSTGSRIFKKTIMPFTIKRAAFLIADSENTKKDILYHFPSAENKIEVIYPGADDFAIAPQPDEMIKARQKYKIDGRYILGVGTIEPRKNISRLIKAFQIISEKEKGIKLVLTGKKGWLTDEIFKEISGIKDNIICTGYVTREELKAIYKGSDLFVYPSLYEGFGLPPLEAMQMGVPVVVSGASSLPEVVGAAGVYIDPFDVESLADGMERVLYDSALRKELVQKGFQQVKKFRWENTAKGIVQLYKKAAFG